MHRISIPTLKIWVPRCVLSLLVAGAAPSAGADQLGALLACRAVADSTLRLACFDRESSRVGTAAGASTGAAAQAALPAAAASTGSSVPTTPGPPVASAQAPAAPVQRLDPTAKFGLAEPAIEAREVAAGARTPDAVKIDAHITAITQTVDGRAIFTLDNGQVWRQLLLESDLLAKSGDAVTLSRGMLGSYWMALRSKRGCKVTRLR